MKYITPHSVSWPCILVSISPAAAYAGPSQVPSVRGVHNGWDTGTLAACVVHRAHLDGPTPGGTAAVARVVRVAGVRAVLLVVVGVAMAMALNGLLMLRLEVITPVPVVVEVQARPDEPEKQKEPNDRPDHDASDRPA